MPEISSSTAVHFALAAPDPAAALTGLLASVGLPASAARRARLTGADPVLPSSFAVGTASQVVVATAALAATELGMLRGQLPQLVSVDMRHAALECTGWFTVNGQVIDARDRFSGIYRTADGAVRIHANFAHHRDGALRLLRLDPATAHPSDAEQALLSWRGLEFETAAAQAGLVVTALRSFDNWDATPQGQALATQPLLTVTRTGDAAPLPLPPLAADARPLSGVRVLELTRILAGPVGGRTLAAHGADVLLLNAPHLPNISAIADTSRGKRSALLDLREPSGRTALAGLLRDAHVFVQGYRPGALADLGYGPQQVAAARPGIVYVSLSAYGTQGPWADRRGFDSLIQTAMGFNVAEREAAGDGKLRPLPMQMLDEASGYLIAAGTAQALRRQQMEGGSWHVQLSLAQTGQWLRGLGRVADGFRAPLHAYCRDDMLPWMQTVESGFGRLEVLRHSAVLERTPAGWDRPAMPPGSHRATW